jgi:hypothetical protein
MGSKGCSTEVGSMKVEFIFPAKFLLVQRNQRWRLSDPADMDLIGNLFKPDRSIDMLVISTKTMLQTETGIMIPSRREEVRWGVLRV